MLPPLDQSQGLNRLACRMQDHHLNGDPSTAAELEAELKSCHADGLILPEIEQNVRDLLSAGETHKAFRICRALVLSMGR